MTETIPDPQAPSHDEHAIVVAFSEDSLAVLSALQHQLRGILGDTIWLTPERALHSTVMEIICDTDYGMVPRKELFTDWYQQYDQIVAETITTMPPFEITFDQLVISPKAIIVKSTDSTILNDIRSTLLSTISLPVGTKLPPDITHCTIARFSSILDLEDIVEQTKMLNVTITERIETFKLLKDLGPPTFDPKTIQIYRLRA